MGRKLLAIFVSLVLMLSCVGVVTIGAAESNIVKIGMFSDTHNGAAGISAVFDNFYELSNGGADLDGVVMNGDIVYMQKDVTPAASHYTNLLSNTKYQERLYAAELSAKKSSSGFWKTSFFK